MLSETHKVRFYETDGLKHVSNTVVAGWFETAREAIFRMFTPTLDLDNWPLILASYKIDFLAQIFYGHDIEIRTGVSRIGKSSFDVYQEIWQKDKRVAAGTTTMVHFDYTKQGSCPIPEDVLTQLNAIFVEPE